VVVSAAIYFGASCLVILACFIGFLLVERLPFTLARKRMNAAATAPLGGAEGPTAESNLGQHPLSSASLSGTSLSSTSQLSPTGVSADAPAISRDDSTLRLACELWKFSASVVLIYVATIAIFPSLTITIVASSGGCQWKALFVPFSFVVFNLADTIGRNMSCVLTRPSTILGLVVARFIFAPLFMLCHTKHAGPLQLPVFAATDAMPYTFMFVFALSNGWLTTSVFVASQGVVEPSKRGRAASLLVCLLNCGIFLGSMLSFLVRFLNCTPTADDTCNPFLKPVINATGTG